MSNLIFTTAQELATSIRQRQVSATEVLEAHLAQIAKYNPPLNAIVTLDEERARTRAKEADIALARGDVWGPLHGVPITIKDAIETAGLGRLAAFRRWRSMFPLAMPQWSRGCAQPVPSFWARPIFLCCRLTIGLTIRSSAVPTTPGILAALQAAPRAGVRQPSLRVLPRSKLGVIWRAQCVTQPTTAACTRSSRPSTVSQPPGTFLNPQAYREGCDTCKPLGH
jgi:hypothetical protein